MPYDINFNEIFDNVKLNKEGQYKISKNNLHFLVDEYITGEDYNDIKKYVSNSCVFLAIKLYEERYGNSVANRYSIKEMYLQLAFVIVMDIIESAEMTEHRDTDDTDDDTDEDTDDDTDDDEETDP